MPKAARDTVITTRATPWSVALEAQHAEERNTLNEGTGGGAPIWHVLIHTLHGGQPGLVEDQPAPAPHVEVNFLVAQHDSGALTIIRWTITGGSDVRLAASSRFPLRTYARAAILAVADALEEYAGLTYEQITAERHAHLNGFDIKAGQLTDQHTRQRRATPKRRYATNGARRPELHRVVDEYRKALERGSRSPTVDVAQAFNVGRSTAARSLAEARRQGLLGAALRTRPGELRDPPTQ